MAKSTKKASEYCRQAAQLILSKGLFKGGDYEGEDGSLCLLGALRKVKADTVLATEQLIVNEIKQWAGVPSYVMVFRWNDDPAVSTGDVYQAMIQAADSLEARGL